jgi:Co/Zn/Cd efflux system component
MTAAPAPSSASRERRAALAAVVVGALLMGAKFVAYHFTRSTVVFSDAMESIANVLASGVAFSRAKAPTPTRTPRPRQSEFISAGFEASSASRPSYHRQGL